MKPSIEIRFQDQIATYSAGSTPNDIIDSFSIKNKSDIVAAEINGRLVDLSVPLTESGDLDFLSLDSAKGLDVLRHSSAHIMAQAVKELFPEVKVTIGPSIEDGFYYDFDTSRPFTPEDLEKIENRMKEIVKSRLPFRRKVMSRDAAIRYFEETGETYKVELIKEINSDEVSLYSQGEFTDLCRGPHIPNSGFVRAFKLMKVAGAYWRGDERNRMLQRIYGTAFPSKEKLDVEQVLRHALSWHRHPEGGITVNFDKPYW
ncbi:MAG: hypothetical protein PHS86_10710, partial [Syntrophaceae bacterium]|nr:hypothetical protein [Syntrophaceae bacterium]